MWKKSHFQSGVKRHKRNLDKIKTILFYGSSEKQKTQEMLEECNSRKNRVFPRWTECLNTFCILGQLEYRWKNKSVTGGHFRGMRRKMPLESLYVGLYRKLKKEQSLKSTGGWFSKCSKKELTTPTSKILRPIIYCMLLHAGYILSFISLNL